MVLASSSSQAEGSSLWNTSQIVTPDLIRRHAFLSHKIGGSQVVKWYKLRKYVIETISFT